MIKRFISSKLNKHEFGSNLSAAKARMIDENPLKVPGRVRRTSVSAEVDKSSAPFVKKVVPKEKEVIERIKAYIGTNFLFNSLPPEHLQEIIDAMEEKTYKGGDTIIKEGESGDNFYILNKGVCDIYIKGKNNGEPIRHMAAGSVFGELALMYNAPRSATVIVQADSDGASCWALDRETFRRTIMIGGQIRRRKYEDFLRKLSLLESFKSSEISHLADAVEPIIFDEGEIIIREGDSDRDSFKFYIIESGRAEAFVHKDGKEVLMSILHAGEFFGEKALVEMTPRTATVKAATKLKCACLSIAAFERLMGSCSDCLAEKASTGYLNVDDVQKGVVKPRGSVCVS